MTAEERIAQLESENAALRGENVALREERAILVQQLEHLLARLEEVEGRLAKDSHHSSKPPSSDGPARKRGSRRAKSGKQTGGQPGHAGRTMLQVAKPDEIVHHRPATCMHCQQSLEAVTGQVKERRQVHDLPAMRVVVQEHQVEQVCCPACQHLNTGSFPQGVDAPVQDGPNVQALGVYLQQYQLVPLGRTCEVLSDLYDCHVSQATLLSWVQQVATGVEATVAQIAEWLRVSRLLHADETGMRLCGKLHWMHVASTRWLTYLAWHPKRGRPALEAIGIWPHFQGRAMRDRWKSYDHYPCAHGICGAHLLRDCTYIQEQEQQEWAEQMHDLLLSMAAAAEEWRQRGAQAVPGYERDEWIAQYFDLLASGFAAQPAFSAEEVPKEQGRRKQSAAKNLLDDLALARRAGPGFPGRSLDSVHQQSGRTRSAHGQNTAEDCGHLSQ